MVDADMPSGSRSPHDEAPVEIVGILKTISDRRAIEVETPDGEVVSIKPGDTTPPTHEQLTLHSYVRVQASEKIQRGPGGTESRSLTLLALDLA